MNEDQAKEIATPLIPGCTVTKIEDYVELFAIHFVNDEYHKSRNTMDMAIGAGPLFIEKETGRAFKTGSGRCTSEYVSAYKACGDVYAAPSCTIEINGIRDGADKSKSILSVKKICHTDLIISRKVVTSAFSKNATRIDFPSEDEAERALHLLCEKGFIGRQLWTNQC